MSTALADNTRLCANAPGAPLGLSRRLRGASKPLRTHHSAFSSRIWAKISHSSCFWSCCTNHEDRHCISDGGTRRPKTAESGYAIPVRPRRPVLWHVLSHGPIDAPEGRWIHATASMGWPDATPSTLLQNTDLGRREEHSRLLRPLSADCPRVFTRCNPKHGSGPNGSVLRPTPGSVDMGLRTELRLSSYSGSPP
jgi:hypothetical protein